MRTVIFGELDSYEDLGLVRVGVEIGSPSPKTNTIEVEGADGVLDLTEYYGDVLYEDRELKMDFQAIEGQGGFDETFGRLYNAVHGRRMEIRLSEQPGYYYVGRVTVDSWKTNERTGDISVTADCEPYRYLEDETSETVEVSGTATETFANLRKRVVPIFDLSAQMQIKQGDTTFTASGTGWSDPRLTFGSGDNTLVFTGTGTVTVKYREGSL